MLTTTLSLMALPFGVWFIVDAGRTTVSHVGFTPGHLNTRLLDQRHVLYDADGNRWSKVNILSAENLVPRHYTLRDKALTSC